MGPLARYNRFMPQLSTAQKILILSIVLVIVAALAWVLIFRGQHTATPSANTTIVNGASLNNVALENIAPTPDADGDGLSDADEVAAGTDAQKADTDGDGLTDFQEVKIYHADPLKTDTDGDGVGDGREVELKASPTGPGPLLDTKQAIQQQTNGQ